MSALDAQNRLALEYEELICPICNKHKAKRFCPAKGEMICAVCCGTEREVTIDCPSDCTYLIAGRRHDAERHEPDWQKAPFPDQHIPHAVFEANELLFSRLVYVICVFAAENPALVDADILAAATAAAETYQTLASGILYENPPSYRLQLELYGKLRQAVEDHKKETPAGIAAIRSVRDSEMRDFMVLFAQIASIRSNGRPKGRAFLDSMRSQFKPGTFDRREPKIILTP